MLTCHKKVTLISWKNKYYTLLCKNVFCSRTNFPIGLNYLKDSELLNITFNNSELPIITALQINYYLLLTKFWRSTFM